MVHSSFLLSAYWLSRKLFPFRITGIIVLDRQPGHLAAGINVIGRRDRLRIIKRRDGQSKVFGILGTAIAESRATLCAKAAANSLRGCILGRFTTQPPHLCYPKIHPSADRCPCCALAISTVAEISSKRYRQHLVADSTAMTTTLHIASLIDYFAITQDYLVGSQKASAELRTCLRK